MSKKSTHPHKNGSAKDDGPDTRREKTTDRGSEPELPSVLKTEEKTEEKKKKSSTRNDRRLGRVHPMIPVRDDGKRKTRLKTDHRSE